MSYSCSDSCPPTSFQTVNASNYLFCRNGAYFVDPSSNSSNELGTFEYPYKRLVAPFREIFNFQQNESRSVTVFLKQGTTILLNSVFDPILIASETNISIQSYGGEPTFDNNPVILSNYSSTQLSTQGKGTTYLPWSQEIQNYDFSQGLIKGKIIPYDLTSAFQKFQIVRSNVSFSNINFTEDKQTPFVNMYFQLSGQVTIQFESCGFYQYENYLVIGTDHPNVVLIRNSKFSLVRSISFVTLENFYIGDCECPSCNQSLIVENSFIYGDPHIVYYGFGPVILRNNTFMGFGASLDFPNLIVYSLTDSLCLTTNQLQLFLIENNTLDNNVKIQFAGNTLINSQIENTMDIVFRYNTIKNVELTNNLVILSLETASKFNFTNNIFVNSSSTTMSMVSVEGPLVEAFVIGNTFENSILDSGFNLLVSQSAFVFNSFLNISSSTDQKSEAIIKIQLNERLSILDTSVLNSTLRFTNLFSIASTSSILIDSLQLKDSTIQQRDFIFINDYMDLFILNISIDQVAITPNIYSVINFNIIPTNSTSQLFNISLTNSVAPLLMMNQILNRDDQPILFLLDNITISNSGVTSTYGFLNFGTFVYPLFSFTISNLTLVNSSMQNSFIVSEMIGTIEITESIFDKNHGIIAQLQPFAINNQQKQSALLIQNCSFSGNNGSANALLITQTNSVIQIVNSTFAGNFGTGRGTIGFADKSGSLIQAENSTFKNNYGMLGGVFFSHMDSVVSANNCLFRSNFACYGGVAYINDEGVIQMTNSTFQNNSALVGNILYLINSNELSILDSSNFVGNRFTIFQSRSSFINTVQSNPLALFEYFDLSFVLKLQNLKQIEQLAFEEDYLVNTQKSSIQILWDQTFSEETHFIYALAGSSVDFIDVTIRNTSLINVISAALSEVSFVRTKLENISDITHNSYLLDFQVGCLVTINSTHLHSFTRMVLSLDSSKLFIYELKILDFQNVESPMFPIQVIRSNLQVSQSVIQSVHSFFPFIWSFESTLTLNGISVSDLNATFIESIHTLLIIQQSNFKNSFAIEMSFVTVNEGYALINSSTFQNCSSQLGAGGVLKIMGMVNKIHSIINCSFEQNSAPEGGSIFVENANIAILQSNFSFNTAIDKGGALSVSCPSMVPNNCQTTLKDVILHSNSAFAQGGSLSYDLIQPQFINALLYNNSAPYGPDIASYPISLQIIGSPSNISSGKQIQSRELTLSLIDQDNQVVLSADKIGLQIYFLNPNYTLLAKTIFTTTNGSFDLMGAVFKGQPGSNANLYFTSQAIDPTKYQIIFNKKFQDLAVMITFRNCVNGEILKDSQCQICLPGTYQLDTGAQKCIKCPKNALCPGGNQISLNKGYWRANTSSLSFYPCLAASACPGGQSTSCAKGYKGVLCHECEGQTTSGYYARSSINTCAKCQSMWIEYMKLMAIVTSLIIYVIIMVAMIIRSPSRDKDSSVLLRILTNYFQIIEMASSLSLNWPPQIIAFLGYFTSMTSSTSQFFNIGCLLQTKLHPNLSLYAIKSLILALLPFIFLIFASLMWKLASVGLPKLFSTSYKRNIYTTTFVFLFLIYSAITQSCFQMFSCVEIDGVYLLQKEMTIECWTPEHRFIILTIGLPILAIWVVGFPVIIFVILFRHRHRLNEHEIILKYGLFYIGLQDKAFYWEIVVINIRKVVCTAIAVCMTQKNTYKLVLVCVLLLIINESLGFYLQPYSNQMLNNVEKASLFASVLTILLGIFFLHQSSSYEHKVLTGIFATIIVINVVFLLYWGVLMISVICKSISSILRSRKLREIAIIEASRNHTLKNRLEQIQSLDQTPFEELDIRDEFQNSMKPKRTQKGKRKIRRRRQEQVNLMHRKKDANRFGEKNIEFNQ